MKKPLTVGSLKTNGTFTHIRRVESTVQEKVKEEVSAGTGMDWDRGLTSKTSTVYLTQNHKMYAVYPENNQSLLDSALDQGCAIDYKCKKGTCGKCRVHIVKGSSLLSEPNEQELVKLGEQIPQGFRLACQTHMK